MPAKPPAKRQKTSKSSVRVRKYATRCEHCATGLAVARPKDVSILYVRCANCQRHTRFVADLELPESKLSVS